MQFKSNGNLALGRSAAGAKDTHACGSKQK